MAKVLSPLMSADAKGSIGGITYTATSVGNVAKKKAKPVRRARREQDTNRSRMGYLARRWGALTDVQRDAWRAWAQDHPYPDGFGGTFIISGLNAFVSLNINAMRLGTGTAESDTPPSDELPASIETLVAATGAGLEGDVDLTVTVNGAGVATDFIEIQIAGPFLSKGRVEVFSRYRFEEAIAGNLLVDTISDLDINFWYWFRTRYVGAKGQTSAWVYGQATPKVGI